MVECFITTFIIVFNLPLNWFNIILDFRNYLSMNIRKSTNINKHRSMCIDLATQVS